MSPKNIAIIAVLGVLFIGGISAFTISSQNKQAEQKKKDEDASMMKKKDDDKMAMDKKSDDAMMKNTDDSMKKDDKMTSGMMSNQDAMMKKGSYVPYSADLVKNAENGNVVLFFNASWCPTCQSTVKDINAHLDAIPSNLTLLSTDYDKETALKQKYGVTTQHTFVKVDKDGNLLKKATGLTTLESISSFAK